jgi:hypothetical protein
MATFDGVYDEGRRSEMERRARDQMNVGVARLPGVKPGGTQPQPVFFALDAARRR